jgi:apolipoprotein D and lipocalin family protein
MNHSHLLATGLLFLSSVLGVVITPSAQAKSKPVETVASVDIPSYMGLWYEYALIPQFFQRKCVFGTQAEYTLLPEGRVAVKNTCVTSAGQTLVANGIAKVADPITNSKLKVTFARVFGKWIFTPGGDYWIMDLAADYSYALVGSPDRKYAWILSRTPHLDLVIVKELAEKLKQQGYKPCELMLSPQEGGTMTKASLCTVLN